ncbi:MAG: delta-60 repeat domain-containing protein [Planctomycetes bacterium]|nr:delta-60 repeat domain-containing protein [Planctomycetota bacterium]
MNAATTWDPDGPGPLGPRLVVGGTFTVAGTLGVNRIATFDPATAAWASLQLGVDGSVNALAVLDNGELVVGGAFGGAFGTICNAIVRWNGTNWAPLGTGLGTSCNALLPVPGGGVIAAGNFASAGGVPASAVAYWNGTTWSSLGAGLGGGFPRGLALARLGNGDVVVGGSFFTAGGVAANGIARWNGASWSAMPGLPGGEVTDLAMLTSGDLIAILNGSLWRWGGTVWSAFAAVTGTTPSVVHAIDVANGDLVVAGYFSGIAGVPANNLARFDGTNWYSIPGAAPYSVNTAAGLPGGALYVGGDFTTLGGVVARSIARWNGSAWSSLGAGPGAGIMVHTVLPDGELVSTTDRRILRRFGATWTPLGGQLPGTVRALVRLTNGDFVGGGDFFEYTINGPQTRLRRWDGSAWQVFGAPLTSTTDSPV